MVMQVAIPIAIRLDDATTPSAAPCHIGADRYCRGGLSERFTASSWVKNASTRDSRRIPLRMVLAAPSRLVVGPTPCPDDDDRNPGTSPGDNSGIWIPDVRSWFGILNSRRGLRLPAPRQAHRYSPHGTATSSACPSSPRTTQAADTSDPHVAYSDDTGPTYREGARRSQNCR